MLRTESIAAIISYIENNYLTIEQLADQSNTSLDKIETLINHGCIPKHSHTLSRQIVFHTNLFGDSIFTEQNKFYYHPSLIEWITKASRYLNTTTVIDVAVKIKADFTQELCQALLEIDDAKKIFNYCFDEDGNILVKGIEKMMLEHWPYIMDGTYGVCLKEITAKNVILKNIAISVLEEWEKNTTDNKDYLYEKAKKAAELYDRVAANFAPHEIIKSTRGRLYNKFKELDKGALLVDEDITPTY